MKVGILGTGFGAYHAELYKNNPIVDKVIIWSRDSEKAARTAASLGIAHAADMRAILENPEISLVDVCLPNGLHRQYAEAALRCGKHVFCETPICGTEEDAAALLLAERESGRRVFVNQFIKFFPEYKYIHDAVTGNAFGRLLSLHAYRKTPAIWGALGRDTITTNLMIHELDFVTWVLGMPTGITVTSVDKNGRECEVTACLGYAGASVHVTASSMMPASWPFTAGYHAVFENGAVDFNGEFPDGPPAKTTTLYTPDAKQPLALPQVNPYEAAIAHVADCCKSGGETVLGAAGAAASLGLACRIREAMHAR